MFAVVFYKYIPNRKEVPEVVEYVATDEVQQMLSDDIDNKDNEVILEYEVKSKDLNNYEATNKNKIKDEVETRPVKFKTSI